MSSLRGAAVLARRRRERQDEAGGLGEPATAVNVRRTRGGGFFDAAGEPDPKAEQQLESYRGTIYAVTTKIADRFARVATTMEQVEVAPDGEEERMPLTDHPFLRLFGEGVGRAPNEEDSVYEFKKMHQLSLDLTGEAWWLSERDRFGVPVRVRLLPAHRMKLVIDEDTGAIGGYVFRPKGFAGGMGPSLGGGLFIPKLPFNDLQEAGNRTLPFVSFFRYPSPYGVEDPRGWSPVKAAAHAWDINRFEMIYKREFLQNGAHLGGVLQSAIPLDAEDIREYTEQFKELHQGAQKAGLPLVLPQHLGWQTTEPTPRDAQWVETVNLSRTEILQVYATSETQLGQADVGNRANSETQEAIFGRDVVQPRIVGFEQKLEGAFLPIYPEQTETLYFDVEHEDPIPKDREFQLKREKHELENRIKTLNEVRQDKGLEPYGTLGDKLPFKIGEVLLDPMDDAAAEDDEDGEDDEGEGNEDDRAAVRVRKPVYVSEAVATPEVWGRQLSESDADKLIAAVFTAESDAEMFARLRPILERIIEEEGALAADLLDGPAGFDPTQVMSDYLRVAENRIKGIGKTTARDVRAAIVQGIREGEGVGGIAKRIQGVFRDAETWRTTAIARTEAVGSANFARQAGYRQAGAAAKEWLATFDGNARDTHAEASGQVVPVDDLFSVGVARLEYPGDPNGPAEEVVNCRCTTLPAALRGEELVKLVPDDEVVREAWWRQFAAEVDKWTDAMEPEVRDEFVRQEREVLRVLATMEGLQPDALL